MDQWRSNQILGNICPTCSVSHFPFCPPPPMSFQNPRFPFDGDPSYLRPPFNPLAGLGPTGTPTTFLGNQNDSFRAPGMLQRDSYGQPPLPYLSNACVAEADRTLKRPRVDDVSFNLGSFDQNYAGISTEHERRLKLIRDHGGAGTYAPEDKRGHFPGSQSGFQHSGNEGFQQSRYGQPGNGSPYQAPGTNGFGQKLQMSHHDNSTANYYNDIHRSHGKDHMLANGHSYPPSTHWQGMNVPHHEHGVSGDPNSQPPLHHGMRYPAPLWQDHLGTYVSEGGRCLQHPPYGGSFPGKVGYNEASHLTNGQPPLPATPPPPLPTEPPCEPKTYFSSPKAPAYLFPISASSCVEVPLPYTTAPNSVANPYISQRSLPLDPALSGCAMEDPSKQYFGHAQSRIIKQSVPDKAKVVDACHLFKRPHRANRPDHIVVILRGLPGSGKSYLAKMLRDLEVENGGSAPRIHSMDDYFMTEVEKTVDEDEVSKSSNSVRPKKLGKKKVMEYCYEPEMEEAYRSSMLKAFKKTVEEGSFTFIIVDDRNLRIADFAQFWATAKRSGYEVYILEATYKDPAGCAARNVHNFTLEDVEKMAEQWEEAPSMYMQLDLKLFFYGDDMKENRIQEVDMDMEDEYGGDGLPGRPGADEKGIEPPVQNGTHDGLVNIGKDWGAEGDHPVQQHRELGKSKWSADVDVDAYEKTETVKGNTNALSGLICAYGKEAKSVRWGDQVADIGFSIGALRNATPLSLVIGPGAGYNLKSNPLTKDENSTASYTSVMARHNVFQERTRAERESFKAVFDKRRHRIGGLHADD